MSILFLRFIRYEISGRRQILCRLLCTEPTDDGEKPLKTKQEAQADKNKKANKSKLASLLMSLNKSTKEPKDYTIETVKVKQLPPETKKYIKEDVKLRQAVKDVAEHIGGDTEKTIGELHSRFESHVSQKHMKDLLISMNISHEVETEKKEEDSNYNTYVTAFYPSKWKRSSASYASAHTDYDILEPLNIFTKLEDYDQNISKSQLSTWDKCVERENVAQTLRAPKNAFEEMIQWTDSGRMWTFPIDNEVGMEKDKSYTFADHIFLERHLTSWCPKHGPIRDFMNMVCFGLSSNPYVDVNRKLAHIQWYQEYFMTNANRELLKGSLSNDQLVPEDANKLQFVNIKKYARRAYYQPPLQPRTRKAVTPRYLRPVKIKQKRRHPRKFGRTETMLKFF